MNYAKQELGHAVAWKMSTHTLPDEARAAAPYIGKDGTPEGASRDVCLPEEYAALSLLPEVRENALSLFADLKIRWHAATSAGPSNHLLSSQVQCVNALGQMVRDPERIVRVFGDLVGIDEVLQIEPGRYLTFEYIGPTDFFGEQPGRERDRGAKCTSLDAAFVHRAPDGAVELVLVEWKYTESYLQLRAADARGDKTRQRRYADFVAAPDGPIRGDVLPFELLLDEPFYQLMRQQLLAHEMEKVRAENADRVRVLHVLSPANAAYQASLVRPEHRELGSSVSEVWHKVLRHTDRFTTVDPAVFLDPEVTSREYGLRYADDVIHDTAGLLTALGVEDPEDVEEVLYTEHEFDGDVLVDNQGIELVLGRVGTSLHYPFRLAELRELADELAE